jgi:hypothetical protein
MPRPRFIPEETPANSAAWVAHLRTKRAEVAAEIKQIEDIIKRPHIMRDLKAELEQIDGALAIAATMP